MTYEIFPPVANITYFEESFETDEALIRGLLESIRDGALQPVVDGASRSFHLGNARATAPAIGEQGYHLRIDAAGLALTAGDEAGWRYGLDSLGQILGQADQGRLQGLEIADEPVLKARGLMLDISRGKVFTRQYLLDLVELLARCRMNILQLYTEHTYRFESLPEIWAGSDPLSAEDILAIGARCREMGVELQANLQSLGHMNRILTRPGLMELAESDMYWSLDTTNEASYELLDRMYAEYLPLFDSGWLNVCSDEPYDLGNGKSKVTGKHSGELYFDHLKRLHDLARKYGKRIMLFGDVVRHHPEFAEQMPRDIIYLDWIYDPKAVYGTPALFRSTGINYWVSPGTGNWNTLFPRLDGSVINIVNLTLEGIREGTQGMLLTDWNDHGGYTQPAPVYYLYAYAGAVAWSGIDPGRAAVGHGADRILDLPGYSRIIETLAQIYQLPPIWSKNRSQCVMALFDEPITGRSVCGQLPPEGLKAYDLTLPKGIGHEFDRHSQHPLRPVFRIPAKTRTQMGRIIEVASQELLLLADGEIKKQLEYIISAFEVLLAKLDFSERLRQAMAAESIDEAGFIRWEDEARLLTADLVALQLEFIQRWDAVAKRSEIAIAITYFSQIITRLDYLRDWLSIQREKLRRGRQPDWAFTTYQTGGYTSLPTY